VPVIAWSLLATYGYVRLNQTGRRRYLAIAIVGVLGAVHADWPGTMYVGALLAVGIVRLISPRVFERIASPRRYAAWWAVSAAVVGLSLAGYLFFFLKSGKIDDFL